jgi:hypothetical protein
MSKFDVATRVLDEVREIATRVRTPHSTVKR